MATIKQNLIKRIREKYSIKLDGYIDTYKEYPSEINHIDTLNNSLLISGIKNRGSLLEPIGGIAKVDIEKPIHIEAIADLDTLPTAILGLNDQRSVMYSVGRINTAIYIKNIESGDIREFHRFNNLEPLLIYQFKQDGNQIYAIDFINHAILQFSNCGKLLVNTKLPRGFDFPIDLEIIRDGKLLVLLWLGYRTIQSKFLQYARDTQNSNEFLIVFDPKSREFTPLGLKYDISEDFPKKMSLDDSGNLYLISQKFLWKYHIEKGIEMIFRGNFINMAAPALQLEPTKSNEINLMLGDITYSRGRLFISENKVNPGIYSFEMFK